MPKKQKTLSELKKNFEFGKWKKWKKPNDYKPFIILVILSVLIASVVPYIKQWVQYSNEDVGLNVIERNYTDWVYKEILIDWNKAIATLSGSGVIENGVEKIQTHTTILPNNDSLKDLGLKNPEIETIISVKDKTSEEFWSEMLPTILVVVIIFILAIFLLSRMWGMANNAMTFSKSRARLFDKTNNKILFKDIAGAEEEK